MIGSVTRNGGRSVRLDANRACSERRADNEGRRRRATGPLSFVRNDNDHTAGLGLWFLDEAQVHVRS